MFKNLKLGTKLNLLLLLIFLGVVGTSGLALSKILGDNAKEKVASQAFLLIETMSSVRDYTATQVNPELAPRLEKEDWFIPQTVPAYSAREVFDKLRKREQYSSFFYKEATLNPTNPRDKSDSFETSIIEKFRNQSQLKEVTGFRSLPSGELFYVARPLVVSEQSCLRCHTTPEQAPKSQISTYGRDNGFGWKLNEIIGAKVISVPASAVFNEARRLQFLVIGSLSVFFLLAMIMINLFLKFAVTNPLKRMAQLSKQVSTGNMNGEFEHPANDEIGILAASLNRMKVSLEMAMNMLNTEIQE
jgi:HAMP domain-containing protein